MPPAHPGGYHRADFATGDVIGSVTWQTSAQRSDLEDLPVSHRDGMPAVAP